MSKVSQAVIMVGGKGTRLKPLTDNIPKPILPVVDRPCLSYLIRSMAEGGVDHIILACGYRSDKIIDAIGYGSDYGVDIEYSCEDRPMGTAGAIKILEDRLDRTFIAANGDVFASLDVKKEIDTHFESNASVTISLTEVENPCEFGIARIDGRHRILEFKEKPSSEEVFSNLINAGIYVVNKDVLRYVPKDRNYDFSKELVPDLMSMGYAVQGHMLDGVWIDVGRPSDLIRANIVMAARIAGLGTPTEGISTEGVFYAGEGSKTASSRFKDSVVSRNSCVTDSDVTDSLILEGCTIENCKITNSIVGRDSVLKFSRVEGETVADGTKAIGNKEGMY